MNSGKTLKIALIGGGPGGLAVLKMFESEVFTQLKARVVGVADVNPKAPGYIYAKQKGLLVTSNYKDFYHIEDLYLLIELTGRDDVLEEITKTKPLHIQLMDHITARLFWDIFQIEEKRKQATRALQRANAFWESIFNCMHDFILVIDKNYNVINANKPVLEKTGLNKEEIKHRKCYEIAERLFLYKPCEYYEKPCPLEEVLHRKKPVTRLYHVKKDNRERYIEVMMYPLEIDGTIDEVVEIQRDITDFMICSAALEETEKKFYSLFETAREAIIILDDKLQINQANRTAARTFGYSQEELFQKDIKELIPLKEHTLYENFDKIKEEPVIVTGIRKNGTLFPVRVSVAQFSFKGRNFFTLIMRDQTRRKELEKKLLQAEKMAAIGQTASFLMHEIKNPLVAIGGFTTQLIRKTQGKVKKKLEFILEEVKRLDNLLSEVRDFTKPIKLEKTKTDINALLKESANLFQDWAKKQNIRIYFNLSPQLPSIFVDPELIKQVFINVIKNAIEAMSEGGRVDIKTSLENSYIKIEISDTGNGIPEEKLKDIFNPFFTTKKNGTGLGLAISYRVVKDHKGDIQIKNLAGKGAACIIHLPVSH